MTGNETMTVRHYCQGIGDCHLISLPKEDGGQFWILIDCGLHSSVEGGYDTMDRVARDIFETTGGKLDLLVVTHEHWDHVSAFLTARDAFGSLKADTVWMGWTEDPDDPLARDLDRFKTTAIGMAQRATGRLAKRFDAGRDSMELRAGLEALSGFHFGAKGEKVRSARDAARARSDRPTVYLEPSDRPVELPQVPGIRVFVLGPPRREDLLKLTVRDSEMYGFGPGMRMAEALEHAAGFDGVDTDFDPHAPFDAELGSSLAEALAAGRGGPSSAGEFLARHYVGTGGGDSQSYRRIDDDWLLSSAELAMQIDSRTNNTSLVLAFQFVETGRVALFAADAQVGNWLGWQDLEWNAGSETVTANDLLENIVYYKVGHHGSENATLRQNGLERMTSPDLSAFVPTNAKDAAKVGWRHMPFGPIMAALSERTSGRVVRADDEWLARSKPGGDGPPLTGSIRSWRHSPGLWFEVTIA